MSGKIDGLTVEQVIERQAQGLTNAVSFKTGRSYLGILRKNAFTFINTVLFGICVLLISMGQVGDALVTVGLVVLNVVVGVFQEARAKYKLDRLAIQIQAQAHVIRSGLEQSIDPDKIVLGDVLVCRPGDQILADGRVIGEGHITVDESNLTGESERIYKRKGDPVYSGSFCITGSTLYEVEKVGAESMLNNMTAAARVFRREKTPLQRDIDVIIRVLVVLVTCLGGLLSISLYLSGTTIVEYLRIAAVIVALVPQGLFFMTTASYGMGMLRVAGKGALIQEANAVESTSHINLLCLDKTGTLTTNQLLLRDLIPFRNDSTGREDFLSALGEFTASMRVKDETLSAISNAVPGKIRQVEEEIPFSSEYKWSALRYNTPGQLMIHVLGAPEMLLPNIPSGDQLVLEVESQTELSRRVLLFARCLEAAQLTEDDGLPKLPPRLEPLGLITFQEELREDARQILEHFKELGVKVKILSGDHPHTVLALAQQVGMMGDTAISGLDLDSLDEAQLETILENVGIFGRITPKQKERLVDFYRQHGYYTAMIGDGVNDILPLKRAHLGISMQSGTSATRSISDIVLLEDRFSALPIALREGQRIVRGMQDVIRLLLTRTFYVFFLILGTLIARVPFPVTPRQNALLATLTVGIPILAIAAWANGGKISKRILQATLRFVVPASFTISILVTGIYLVYLNLTQSVDLARTALTGASIFCGLLLLPFCEPPTAWWVAGDELSGDPRPTYLAFTMIGLYGVVMGVPKLRDFFELVSLTWWDYLIIASLSFLWALAQRGLWRSQTLSRLWSWLSWK